MLIRQLNLTEQESYHYVLRDLRVIVVQYCDLCDQNEIRMKLIHDNI